MYATFSSSHYCSTSYSLWLAYNCLRYESLKYFIFIFNSRKTRALPYANCYLVARITNFVFILRGNFGIVQIFRRWRKQLVSKYSSLWQEPWHLSLGFILLWKQLYDKNSFFLTAQLVLSRVSTNLAFFWPHTGCQPTHKKSRLLMISYNQHTFSQ